MANAVAYKSKLTGGTYYIKYNPDNQSAEGLTGNYGITNAKYIRDFLLSLGWRKAQIVAAVAAAQRYAFLNPAKGFGEPDATTGGFWNKRTDALYRVWSSHYGTEKVGYGDASLLLLQGHASENSGFNNPYHPTLNFRGFIRGRIGVALACQYFWNGYVYSGITSIGELDIQYARQQGNYWERILFGTESEKPDNPDPPDDPTIPDDDDPDPDPDPDYPYDPTPDNGVREELLRFLIIGTCGMIAGRSKPTYLRGDCT